MIELLLIGMALSNAAGLLLVKRVAALEGTLFAKLRLWELWAGVSFLIASPLCLVVAARYCTLSKMCGYSALSYIFILLASKLFLHEKIDGRKIFGSLLIIAGILALK